MIKVLRNKKNIKEYTFDMFWVTCKPLVILNSLFLLFMIFFLLVGIFSDKEAFEYFYYMISAFVFLLAINLRMFYFYKKNTSFFFNTCDENGNIEEIITLENDEYVINNITHKTINRIKKSDIKSIFQTKKAIIIRTIYNQKVYIPKSDELLVFFELK